MTDNLLPCPASKRSLAATTHGHTVGRKYSFYYHTLSNVRHA